MAIERHQKVLIFEEAARRGVVFSDLPSIPDLYQEILGIHDIGDRKLGNPLTPIYTAKTGELIDIPRISAYFTGLVRDLKVADYSLTELENNILMTNLEVWARMQLVKNRASLVSEAAHTERVRTALGADWAYTESFHNTNRIDMERTSAWIDTAEGAAFLPVSGNEQSVPPSMISIGDIKIPGGVSLLGSTPMMAFDGLESTNWRAIFGVPPATEDDGIGCTAILSEPRDIMGIMLDPIGFGTIVSVDADNGDGFKNVVKAVIYNRKTFPVEMNGVKKIRISMIPDSTAYPRTVGLRNVILYSSLSSRFASVYSLILKPTSPFTQIKIESTADVPNGSEITPYYATAEDGPWVKLNTGDWGSVDAITSQSINIDFLGTQLNAGLYRFPTGTNPSVNSKEGFLEVGRNQMEVACLRRDYSDIGEAPHTPEPGDFSTEDVIRTWSPVDKIDINTESTIIQEYGVSIPTLYGVTRGQQIAFQRKYSVDPYTQLCFVPLMGSTAENTMQFNHTYRFRCWVHCTREGFYDQGKYWFYQGYRLASARKYREVGKSYSAFSVYMNGELIASDNTPYTISSDNSIETGGESGRNFSMKLIEGWNLFEVYMHVVDPSIFYSDAFEVGSPYVQLSLTPCLFDPSFQLDYGITAVLGSGQRGPVDSFDLLWNLPLDQTYWSWSDDRQYIMFNRVTTRAIDGYFAGSNPDSLLLYKGIGQESSDLFIRMDLEREAAASAGPYLRTYRVMVR